MAEYLAVILALKMLKSIGKTFGFNILKGMAFVIHTDSRNLYNVCALGYEHTESEGKQCQHLSRIVMYAVNTWVPLYEMKSISIEWVSNTDSRHKPAHHLAIETLREHRDGPPPSPEDHSESMSVPLVAGIRLGEQHLREIRDRKAAAKEAAAKARP
jgi:ribonuclease HI